jgi:pSer/pThr/pTyr-binding forkhead associated (FHA) protein
MLTLLVEAGPDAGNVLRFSNVKRSLLLGAGPDAEVRIRGVGVADRHARIVQSEFGGLTILRLGSVELRVNGRSSTRARLQPGDRIRLGAVSVRVATQRPLLRVVVGLNEGDTFEVSRGLTLGRSVSADVTLFDLGCSRDHCRIEKTGDNYFVVDLGSRNGSSLNGAALQAGRPYPLHDGDRLESGNTILEFVMTGEPAAAPASQGEGGRKTARKALAKAQTERHVRSRNTAGHLVGDLDRVGFAQIVQLLSVSKKSGELHVQSASHRGRVTFRDGRVHDAWSTLSSAPKESFFALAKLNRGRFEFRQGVVSRDASIERGTLALLMDAARLADEY